jgi:hypothetical protein
MKNTIWKKHFSFIFQLMYYNLSYQYQQLLNYQSAKINLQIISHHHLDKNEDWMKSKLIACLVLLDVATLDLFNLWCRTFVLIITSSHSIVYLYFKTKVLVNRNDYLTATINILSTINKLFNYLHALIDWLNL